LNKKHFITTEDFAQAKSSHQAAWASSEAKRNDQPRYKVLALCARFF